MNTTSFFRSTFTPGILAACAFALDPGTSQASIAYGSLNNFDTVNDTGTECHGFEIEIDDVHSKDITYTYDYNHYGAPKITEDDADPAHPKVFVRYAATFANGAWSAFTAVPAAPIAPTAGHQFTNPSVNFGGEHFGVGYYGTPTAVKYNWLIDDGAQHLVHGPPVNIATPAFTYAPAAGGAAANVQAAIEPPVPPVPPPLEFGDATWVKEIRTTTHNNKKVELKDLMSADPDYPADKNWKNGEPDEVEVEWQILQADTTAANGGANGELKGAPEGLANGDEVVTRRYEFYKYTGPLDSETGEADADNVGPDGKHGVGTKMINGSSVDLSTVQVVGDYIGAQMAAFDAAGKLGLVDHVQDGEVNAAYVERTVVIAGNAPFTASVSSGALPDGLTFDQVTGVLSGTPTKSGLFTFAVQATDTNNGQAVKSYTIAVAPAGGVAPAHGVIITSALPAAGGTTSGDGTYPPGLLVRAIATAKPGFAFLNWTEGGVIVSSAATYNITSAGDRTLVANFVQTPIVSFAAYKGSYFGLSVEGTPQLRGAGALTLTAKGAFTAGLNLDGTPSPLVGAFKPDGTFSKTILRRGLPAVTVKLALDATNHTDAITGSISDGAAMATVTLNRFVYSAANPVPPALLGSYTLLLPPDASHPGPGAPGGAGFGRVAVTRQGSVIFVGSLGDGTAVSAGAPLSKSSTWGFYVAPYGRGGGLASGWLTFRNTVNASDLDGLLSWNKKAVARPARGELYPAGFTQQITAVGSRYTPPARFARVITLPDKAANATVNFSGAGVNPAAGVTITLAGSNRVTAAPGAKLAMRVSATAGLFGGAFTPPGMAQPIFFGGALFQKHDANGFGTASGLFFANGQTGFVDLEPAP